MAKAKRRVTRRALPGKRRAIGSAALLARLAALEERVGRIETGKPPPGDGRRAAPRPRPVRRCPGCGLPLRVVRGRCTSCDRPVDADGKRRGRRPA